MSNRSLVELNHDFFDMMAKPEFVETLQQYLANASPENADRLYRFGVRVFGMRHHSEHFDLKWGQHRVAD